MATSNSINFNMDRNTLCLAALRTAGLLGIEQAVCPAALLNLATQKLNQLIKHWENSGYHLWTREHATVFLNPNQAAYSLGVGGDRATNTLVQTTITANAAVNATTITAASVTGMTAADNIGICLDAGTTQWTTISSINTNTKVITLGTGLTSAASASAVIFSYTSGINRPLAVESATIRDVNLTDRMLGQPKGRQDYFNYPLKSVSGTVVSYYYDTRTADLGILYVYQSPTLCTETLQIEYVRSIQDFDSATDAPDLPQRWLLALEYNLAVLLCSPTGKENKKTSLHSEAQQYLAEASAADYETGTIFMIPGSNY